MKMLIKRLKKHVWKGKFSKYQKNSTLLVRIIASKKKSQTKHGISTLRKQEKIVTTEGTLRKRIVGIEIAPVAPRGSGRRTSGAPGVVNLSLRICSGRNCKNGNKIIYKKVNFDFVLYDS